jgi:hypothetical protein
MRGEKKVKKWTPVFIIVICMILIGCVAYFVRPYRTDAPGITLPDKNKPLPETVKTVWINKEKVVSVEWDGKRISWLLRRSGSGENPKGNEWTLNGNAVNGKEAETIISEMNALFIKATQNPRQTSSLKNEAIDTTVTIVSGPDNDEKVYFVAVAPDDPQSFWIVPAGEAEIYPVSVKDMQLLEKTIDQIKASAKK